MDRHDDEQLPEELQETASWMRESRAEPTRLRLDELKQRALRQATARRRGTVSGRWRIRIVTSLMVLGLMMTSLTGVVMATGGGGFSLNDLINLLSKPQKDPSTSMYCPPDNHGDDDDDGYHHGDDDDDGWKKASGDFAYTTTGGSHSGGDKPCIPCPKTLTTTTTSGSHGGGTKPNPCDPKPGCGPDKTDGTAGNSGTHMGQPPKDQNRGDCPNPPGQNKPEASCAGASAITSDSATLNGSVKPNGQDTIAYFEYGSSAGYIGKTGAQGISKSNSSKGISAGISGLKPYTTYYFRVVAKNVKGTTYGPKCSFKTKYGKPDVSCGHSNVGYNGAKLTGAVNPNGDKTTVYFEYGKTSSYGSKVGSTSFTGDSSQAIASALGNLQRKTKYYYRVVASNGAGSSTASGSFTTD